MSPSGLRSSIDSIRVVMWGIDCLLRLVAEFKFSSIFHIRTRGVLFRASGRIGGCEEYSRLKLNLRNWRSFEQMCGILG